MYGITILVLMFALMGCSPSKPSISPESKDVKLIEAVKRAAVAKCIKWKKKEYNWKPEEMKEYCEEMWRGYRDRL